MRVFRHIAKLFVALTGLGSGPADNLARKCGRSGEQIAFDDSVNNAVLQRVLCSNRIAGGAHFDGLRHPCEPGETLCARRARYQTELHFRLADLCAGYCHSIVAGHR